MLNHKESSRAYTKRVLSLNLTAAWVFLSVALYNGQIGDVVTPVMTMIAAIFTAYAGVGHMDFRTASSNAAAVENENG